jgi:hypothetical protein
MGVSLENIPRGRGRVESAIAMFSTCPEDARWNADRQAVEFGVEIGEYRGMVRVRRSGIPAGIGPIGRPTMAPAPDPD